MNIGIWQIVIVVVLVVLLFGRGKISELMGDVAKGITSFKKGLKEEDNTANRAIDQSNDDQTVHSEPARSQDKA